MKFIKFFKRKDSKTQQIKRRVYVDNPRYYTQLYASSDLKIPKYSKKDLKKIVKRRRKGKIRSIFENIKQKFTRIITSKIIGLTILVFLLLGFYFSFKNLALLNVSEIEIIGNRQISQEELESVLDKYKNANLMDFSVKDVEKELRNDFALIKEVYARKYLPNKLEVEIIERNPSIVVITFDAIHIVGTENVVIEQIETERLDLISFERNILNGDAGIDDTYVKEQYFLNLDLEENEKAPDWNEVSQEAKEKIFDKLKAEVFEKLNNYFENQRNLIPEKYKELPIIIFYTNQTFSLNKRIEDEQIIFSNEALIKLSKISFKIEKIVWISQFSAEFILTDGKILVLSRLRSLDDQIEDIALLLDKIPFEKFTRFDVRVPTIAIE